MTGQSLTRLTSRISRPLLRLPYSRTCIAALRSRWRTHVWIVAPPKTGSTWLSLLLLKGLEWNCVPLSAAIGASEQEADLTQLLARAALHGNTISPTQHCRYSANTQKCVTAADIKVVLLTRNLMDSIVSFRDHMNQETTWPMAFMTDSQWQMLNASAQLDFVIDMVAPWYFNFYAGWFNSPLIGSSRLFRLTYEELLADSAGKLEALYSFLDVRSPARSPREAVAAVEMVDTRRNQARSGRGDLVLSPEQKQRLLRLSRYYPTTDFSSIGLA